jgi:HSP20 family protein
MTRSLNSTLDRMMTLNRAFDHALSNAWTADSRVWVPAIDVIEKKDAYVLHAELPGVDASQVDISFEQNVLTVRGTKPATIQANGEGEVRVYAAERVMGSFERSIKLPEFVDGERIAADFSNGLLTVTVPKAKAAQARKIEIKAAGQVAAQSNAERRTPNAERLGPDPALRVSDASVTQNQSEARSNRSLWSRRVPTRSVGSNRRCSRRP